MEHLSLAFVGCGLMGFALYPNLALNSYEAFIGVAPERDQALPLLEILIPDQERTT